MFKSKYIIVKQGNITIPIVFCDVGVHADIAYAVGGQVVGAGFCFIDENKRYSCYGESYSLKVKSGPDDADILNRFLGVDQE